MDITFKTDEGIFNYRVCAIIVNDGKLLAMKNERSPYYYLPGGRVHMNETAEAAVLRELKEELDIDAEIIRPLWLAQSYFDEDVTKQKFHELCLYFLVDADKTDLLNKGASFTLAERHHTHNFQWLKFECLENEYIYPLFIKKDIFNLPKNFTLRTKKE